MRNGCFRGWRATELLFSLIGSQANTIGKRKRKHLQETLEFDKDGALAQVYYDGGANFRNCLQ